MTSDCDYPPDEHDGEEYPAVLVDITPSHPEYSVRGFGRGEAGQGELNRLRVAVPDVVMISGQSVVSSSDGAGHHTAGVELELGLKGFEMICVTNIILYYTIRYILLLSVQYRVNSVRFQALNNKILTFYFFKKRNCN